MSTTFGQEPGAHLNPGVSLASGSGVLNTPGDLEENAKLAQRIEQGNVVPPGSRRSAQTATRRKAAAGSC